MCLKISSIHPYTITGWILPITLLLCSLALDAMLKSAGVEPRLSGGDMYLFFEKGIRGGVSKNCEQIFKGKQVYG